MAALALPAEGAGPWVPEEVWAFAAAPDLRVVDIEGVPAWTRRRRRCPWSGGRPPPSAYPGERMRFVERRRGDGDPGPDQLSLKRTLWIDFDGGGASFRDRVSRDAHPRLPPRCARSAGTIDLEGEGRVEGSVRGLPANGWAHEFRRVSSRC